MKQHLVIVCGLLYPNPSPTGLCAYRYASLLSDHYDMEFIAMSENGKEEDVYYEGISVHTLSSKRLFLEYKTKGIIQRFIHLLGSAQIKLFMNGNLDWFSTSAYKRLEAIHRQKPIDVLLTVCSPFPAHIAGVFFKKAHPEVKLCAYTVDPFAASDRIIPIGKSFKDLIEFEREVSAQADCLFLSEEAIQSRSDIYGDIQNKRALPYLLPKRVEVEGGMFDKEYIHCVYAGSFYKDIRNPEYMLKVFSSLRNKRIILHLYSAGCADLINKYEGYGNIQAKGYISQGELQRLYSSCDFLIGVGNAINDFLPSKTYEYISLRRPIIFFNPKGFGNKVLEQYPHSLQIADDTSIEKAVTLFEDFVSNEKGRTISVEDLNEIYACNTTSNIKSILLKGLN